MTIKTATKHFLKQLYGLWMKFAKMLGTINSVILLTVIFFVLMAPFAAVKKMTRFKKQIKGPRWTEKKYTKPLLDNLKKQF